MLRLFITLSLLFATDLSIASDLPLWVQGLAKEGSWQNYPLTSSTVVCNVKETGNGPESYLNVRSCADTSCEVKRSLFKNAIVMVSPGSRIGNWVKVDTAYRIFSRDGKQSVDSKSLHVTGWAHVNYLCDFTNL